MCHLLLKLLRQNAVGYKLSEDELLDAAWCISVGMGAFLYHSIDKTTLQSLSPSLHDELRASYFSSVFAAQDQSSALLELLKTSTKSRFQVCVLKGMSVSHQYYELPHLRLMRDIDLLVAAEDVTKLESILFQQGYRQFSENTPSYYQMHHHTMPFYHEQKKVWVEVHTLLFREKGWRGAIPAFSAENIFQEMLPATFEGESVNRLSAELQLIYIAAHWVDDFKPRGGLFAIWDATFLLRQEKSFDWDKVLAWTTESSSLALPVYLLLNNLCRYQLVEIDAQHMKQLRKNCIGLMGVRCAVFNGIVDHFYLQQGVYGKLLNEFSLDVMWSEAPKSSFVPYIFRVVWKIMFPENVAERYSMMWHARRLKKLLGLA